MKRILLVEDDPFIVDIYSSRLKSDGFSVDVANNGDMALEKLKAGVPDLMVLDLLLPTIDGWEVLKNVRSDPRTKDVKVMVISNLDQNDNTENILHFNVLKYLLKVQTTPEELSKAVKEIIGQ